MQTRNLWLSLLIAVATAAAFSPVLQNGFVNMDDQLYVTSNPVVQSGLNTQSLAWAFTTREGGNYHPLTWVSHLIDVQLFGLNPTGHHAHSLLLHTINAVLLLWLMLRLSGSIWISVLVSMFFALHPLRVESVAWVSERKDVLSGLFFLLTLLAYAKYAGGGATLCGAAFRGRGESPRQPASPSGVPASGSTLSYSYWFAIIFFTLGLLSKSMLVTVPCVLLLLDVWPLGRLHGPWSLAILRSRVVIEKLPFFALSAFASLITFRAQAGAGAVASVEAAPFGDRLTNSLIAVVRYLAKTFWPVDLVPFYPLNTPVPLGTAVVAGLILTIITFLAWRCFSRQPSFLIGWLWFIGMLVPVIGLVQVGMQSMADRYTYLPGIGLALAAAWGMVWMGERLEKPAFFQGLGIAASAACAFLAYQQTLLWHDSETLFRYTLRVDPRNVVAHHSLGNALADQGKLPEALHHFEQAIASNPKAAPSRADLGLALVMSGRVAEGIEQYRVALRLLPTYEVAHYNLGRALSGIGRYVEALDSYEAALRLRSSSDTLLASAETLAALGRIEESEQRIRTALQSQPDNLEAQIGLAEVLAQRNNAAQAVTQMEAVVAQNPGNPDLRVRAGMLCSRLGLNEQAKTHFREALKLRKEPQAVLGLATSFDALGQHAEAAAQYREALRLSPNAPVVLNNLAWLLASSGDDQVRNGLEAVKLGEALNTQTENKEAIFLGTLAAAYAEAGRFEDAVRTARRAQEIAQANQQPQVAQRNAELIELYQAGKAFHQPTR